MSFGEDVEPFTKEQIEEKYWVDEFIPWLRETPFDFSDGDVNTVFWYWYTNIKFPKPELGKDK